MQLNWKFKLDLLVVRAFEYLDRKKGGHSCSQEGFKVITQILDTLLVTLNEIHPGSTVFIALTP